ncbi:ricin-type beta-trefoil lectin domain protein [Dactylosporangium sp. AC04546]|uniref:ricin-type beta-trefoil lectin domain protein n=1 Tax=Dactylosporangium sp. AC04546 TaxID=2862460 RepID=UPI002E7C24ED|nr:ricin-type beta-trefoil lectin domain protein [Dactylosporangium sp. AC04546]WVK84373.1 ricin-type beta-trefoil lectin domain protein [Dactylosporangium sp. AC04546]
MSVAGDEQEPSASDRRARHRVPPTASASASVPELPEPFNPAKPTFPAIPRQQRREGPTAIATASVPAVDPATVATYGGEMRASAVEPQRLEFVVSLPGVDDSPVSAAPVSAAPVSAAPSVSAPPYVSADDSPTVADYVPPAYAIVTDEPHEEDGPDYRGNRRKTARLRRIPVGAVAVAVLILLITGAVVFQLVRDDGPNDPPSDRLPQKVPGVGALPGGPAGQASESPTSTATGSTAAPSNTGPSASRSAGGGTSPLPSASNGASPSASPRATTTSAAPPPPPPPPVTGRVVGVGSNKCVEYRSGDNNRVVLDTCDGRSNQHWEVRSDGTVRADGLCLDVQNAGTANRTLVQAYGCNGTPAQKWVIRADKTWMNPNSGRCLDAENGGTGAGTRLIIWDCSAASNQRWNLLAF